jgi:predicted dehydrogenase
MAPVGKQLTAVVVGAGFAGEGHTIALRSCGVDVVAICARQPEVVRAVADRLGVAEASTDWRRTLAAVKPDIVCVGTPATVHGEIVEAAATQGASIYCDKPLATTAAEAQRLYRLVEAAGVKHTIAATHHYDPSVIWIAQLIREGVIGTLREIEGTFRRYLAPLTPWTWYDTLATGGGLLHNAFPHWLAILQRMSGGTVVRAMGEARVLRDRAPYVPNLHDFRDRGKSTPSEVEATQVEWRTCDADNAFSALLRFRAPGATAEVQATLSVTGTRATWPANGWRLHGDGGTLIADGHYSYEVSLQRHGSKEREALPVPAGLTGALPRIGDEFQNKWAALAQQFVADIRGEPHEPYLSFLDGWRFQETMEAIRSGRGWTDLPA